MRIQDEQNAILAVFCELLNLRRMKMLAPRNIRVFYLLLFHPEERTRKKERKRKSKLGQFTNGTFSSKSRLHVMFLEKCLNSSMK